MYKNDLSLLIATFLFPLHRPQQTISCLARSSTCYSRVLTTFVELLDTQLFHTELEMANLVTCLHSVLMTIPGIGFVNGGIILGEVGDIHRFSSPSKLLAYAGLDPSIYQSGNFHARRTRMSKRGSRTLRYALMNAAHNVVKNNDTFKTYYDAKRAEGRTHYNALGHCAGKLVRVIWKMLTDNVEFNLK